LTIGSDARVLAHLAQYEGVRAIDVISGRYAADEALRRLHLRARWTASGGRLPSDLRSILHRKV